MNNVKNKYPIILSFNFLLLCIGCSSLSGPLFKPILDIPTGKCIIYLYRLDDEHSSEFTVACNDSDICILEKWSYFPIINNAGKVKLSASVNFKLFTTGFLDKAIAGTTELIFKTEPGQSYYIECQALEWGGNKLTIKLVPKNFGMIRVKECRLLDPISY